MIKQKYDLVNIIYNDLRNYGKLQFFLLCLAIISAMSIIVVTHQTRSLISDRERLFLERDMLDVEWRNLIIEEKFLSIHSRIEQIAIDLLNMYYPEWIQEDIFD